jgi:hypothetical protein
MPASAPARTASLVGRLAAFPKGEKASFARSLARLAHPPERTNLCTARVFSRRTHGADTHPRHLPLDRFSRSDSLPCSPTRATRDVSSSRAACRLCDTALYGRFIWHSGGGDQCGGLGWGCCGEHLSSGTRQVLHPSPSSRDHSGGWGAVIGNHHSLIILYILRPVCLAPSSFDNRGGGLSFRPNLFLYLKNMQTVVTPLTPRMFDRGTNERAPGTLLARQQFSCSLQNPKELAQSCFRTGWWKPASDSADVCTCPTIQKRKKRG